ncbi:MAG: acyl-CoA dehydrogenase domain-containing protein [Gammaproteobacteria bacterium]|nr:acyl-CoA dehydrogenase domain-containing protein [Gammaproteobacteria bacterium]
MTGAYSMVREQFGIPIGLMEGVQSKVAGIAAMTYAFEGARIFTCSAIDAGEKPPVISALLKAAASDYAQRLAIDSMDVFAGSGVMQGPNNIVGSAYSGAPVSVTVEGANIMTRTLMVFGQGATRCHPHALDLVGAVEKDDVDGFKRHLLGWFGHTAKNWLRHQWSAASRAAWSAPAARSRGPTATYYRRLAWASARFALLADLAMYAIGGSLKARGNLSGRFSDALTWQVLAMATLRRFEAEGRRMEDLPLVRYACEHALGEIQQAFEGIHANFDAPVIGWWLRHPAAWLLRLNPLSTGAGDRLVPAAAATIQSPGEQYQRLTEGLAKIEEGDVGAGRLMRAFRLRSETRDLRRKLDRVRKNRDLPDATEETLIEAARTAGDLGADEAARLLEAHQATLAAWEVDVFTPDEYFRDEAPESASGRRDENAA